MIIILILIGVSGGMMVAGGLFALLNKVGVITRMVMATKTGKHFILYQWIIIAGGTLGNLFVIFNFMPHLPGVGLIILGLGAGVFTGALSLALAETLDVFPIVFRKAGIKTGINIIVLIFALGKTLGSLYQLVF